MIVNLTRIYKILVIFLCLFISIPYLIVVIFAIIMNHHYSWLPYNLNLVLSWLNIILWINWIILPWIKNPYYLGLFLEKWEIE
jgi:hypothetical protein